MGTFVEALDVLMSPDACQGQNTSARSVHGSDTNREGSSRSQTGFAGVTLHKRTQRYEAHIWAEKKQIYLGSYNLKWQAARVHDIAALKLKPPPSTELNFPLDDYNHILPFLLSTTPAELVLNLRNYSKSLNASGRPSAPPPAAALPPLPPQHAQQAQPEPPAPAAALTRRSSEPLSYTSGLEIEPARQSKRKQSRPSSALDSPLYQEAWAEPQRTTPVPVFRPSPPVTSSGPAPRPAFPLFQGQTPGGAAAVSAGLPPPLPLQLSSGIPASVPLPSEVPGKSHKVRRRVAVSATAGTRVVLAPAAPAVDQLHEGVDAVKALPQNEQQQRRQAGEG